LSDHKGGHIEMNDFKIEVRR